MNAPTDLLRLLAIPILGWASLRDVRTRRVPNWIWGLLVVLGGGVLVWEVWTVWHAPVSDRRLFVVRVAVSAGVVVPLSYLFFRLGAFGGADAKALAAVCLCFPTPPSYLLAVPALALPLFGVSGAFAVTVLTNAALVGAVYPLSLVVRNALAGRFSATMAVGRPISWERIPKTHGQLLGSKNGLDAGLDLDALRMYLVWRGATLTELRAAPAVHRDPASLPAEPNPPGDGRVVATDGGRPTTESVGDAAADSAPDPWGAAAFLDDAGTAYDATPARLRAALDTLTTVETVWISPGIPFLVPLFCGLCIALVYGDLLSAGLAALSVI